MKRVIFIFLILFFKYSLYAAMYEEIGTVRAKGMGEALEAFSTGIDSILYNPAGTAYIKNLQVYNSFGQPAVGFDDGSFIYSFDFGVSVPFINYIYKPLTFGNKLKIFRDGALSFFFHNFAVSDLTYERLFKINIAKNLNNVLFEGANISAGLNFNIYWRGFRHTEDTLIHPDPNLIDSNSGFGLDFGLTYDFSKNIRLAFVIDNLIEPNLSFFKDSKEYVNQKMKAGLSYKLGTLKFFNEKLVFQNLVLSGGFEQISRDSEDKRKAETFYKAGFEFWEWKEQIGIRAGYITGVNVITSGLSFKYKFKNAHIIILNWAFNYPLISQSSRYFFSLNYEYEFPDYYFDYMTEKDIEEENRFIEENYRKGFVIKKYKTAPNDNLYNVSLINYGTADRVELLKQHNKLEDIRNLPPVIEIPYDAKYFELYKIQPSDTLESIAEKYYGDKTKTDGIRRFNEIEFSRLRVGQILILPKPEGKAKEETETKKERKPEKIQKQK